MTSAERHAVAEDVVVAGQPAERTGRGGRVRSLRTTLFVLVLATIVPAALLALWLLIVQYRDQVADSRNQSLARARALAAAVDSQLLQVQSALYGLATASTLHDSDLWGFHERATELAKVAGIASIALVDGQHRQLVNTLLPFGTASPQLDGDAPGLEVIREGHPVARMAIGAVTGQPVAVVGVPVRQDGVIRYALSSSIGDERFAALVAAQRLPSGWIAAIVDPRGTIAWRNIRGDQFIGKPASAGLREHMAQAPEGAFEGMSLDGVDTLTVYTRAPQSGWTMVFGIPQAEFFANLARSLVWLASGTTLVFVLSGWAAWTYGRQMVRTVAALVTLSGQLATRPDVEQPLLEFREAQQLGESMVRASHLLHEAHADVAQKEARLRALLDAAMDGVIVIDGRQRIVQCNAAACRIFGYPAQELEGSPLERLLPEDARPLHQDHVAAMDDPGMLARTMTPGRRVRALHRDGHDFPIEASIARFESEGQAFFVAIVRDVTQRQRMEDELLRSNLELRQFAHAASHDMRSPLRSIIGLLSVATDTREGAHQGRSAEFVQRALRAARQLDHFTDDLLAYARLEGPAPAMAPVDLAQCLAEARTLLETDIEESGAEIVTGPLPVVNGYAPQLTQLFHNLLGNAIKFRGSRPPVIRVQAEAFGQGWQVDVADNGMGIEAAYHEKVFEIFQRLHSQAAIPGSGIGLAICRKVVQRHGGRIWVDSTSGGGSTFHFTLNERAAA